MCHHTAAIRLEVKVILCMKTHTITMYACTQQMITDYLSNVSSKHSHRFTAERPIVNKDPHYNNICMHTIDDYLLSFRCVITRQL